MDTEKVVDLGAEWAAEMARLSEQLLQALDPIWTQLSETFRQIAAALSENMATISAAWLQNPSWEFVIAYAWACEARPKWVRILNRTKKERTRKKYQDRILRAYREIVKGEQRGHH